MGDVARLSEQLESSLALSPLLANHREEIEPLGFAGKVLEEVVAESLRGVDATVEKVVEKVVENVIRSIVEFVDEVIVESVAGLLAAGVADGGALLERARWG